MDAAIQRPRADGLGPASLPERALRILATHYGFGGGCELAPTENLHVFRITISGGRRHIFKFHNPLAHPNAALLETIYRRASLAGFIPHVHETVEGRVLGGEGEDLFSLQDYVQDGRVAPADAAAWGARLAKFHALLREMGSASLTNHLFRAVPDMRRSAADHGYGDLVGVIDEVEAFVAVAPSQVIHGDLHPGNLLNAGDRLLFIDLDSATSFSAWSDAAFAAFRLGAGDMGVVGRFLDGYNAHSGVRAANPALIRAFAVFNVLQRILFILTNLKNGNPSFLVDFDKQRRLLGAALAL